MSTFLWYCNITFGYLYNMLPCAAIAVVIYWCSLPWRKRRLSQKGLKSHLRHEALFLFFVTFSSGLAALTLVPETFWTMLLSGNLPMVFLSSIRNINLTPSVMANVNDGTWSLYLLIGNIVMFVPLGIIPPLMWEGASFLLTILVGSGASFLIESLQYFIGRSCDINDLILNTVGVLIGFWLYYLLCLAIPKLKYKFKCVKVEVLYGR